ncbi:MAG: winged helix-turn-helix domain-containing protein, partial [Opitutales bacterium]|nr:winged helix-turn-helix domain-containing protein [Opitutales bacterium]
IHAVLRRAECENEFNVTKNVKLTDAPFTFNTARVNPTTMELAFADGEVVTIGRKEIGILSYINENPSTIITRKNLIHSVWGIHADIRSRSLDQYIVKIRDLFKRKEVPLNNLKTIHGIGYQYEPMKTAEAPQEA